MVVGCAGVRSEASKQEEQGRTETTKHEQGHTKATKDQYGSEEARCRQTRTYRVEGEGLHRVYTTNDVPGCPKGGLLSGTDGEDHLDGQDGDDEIHGLGGLDGIDGGGGNDVIYGGPGDDYMVGEEGDDVLYGGDGNDALDGIDEWPKDTQRDELYCGPGKDVYDARKLDYVDSSCEKKEQLTVGL
jgi:hypothetical protein